MERERHSISRRRVFGLVSLRQKESLLFAVAITSAAIGGCSDKEIPLLPEEISGHCNYTNKFSSEPECRNYHGDWPVEKDGGGLRRLERNCRHWDSMCRTEHPRSVHS
jgi:hypothetical protein